MIRRTIHLDALHQQLREFPVVAVIGARQIGKTTLAHDLAEASGKPATVFDLENPAHRARLSDPMAALEPLRGLVVIDEIQHAPDLFMPLRVLADRRTRPASFLILGSASPDLLRQSSESLAGRIAYYSLPGFALDEVGVANADRLWLRGRFPKSFLAKTDRTSFDWRTQFVRTFLERDLPQLGITIPSATMSRFWNMLAHYHGQIWNGSEFARSFGVSDMTVRRYLDILGSTFAIRQLQPWHENIKKRQVKSPKVYLTDPGILHALLGLETQADLMGHPKVGASWEGYALDLVVQHLGARPRDAYFWATHTGAELDLLVIHGNRRLGYEFKLTSAPAVTPSMRHAIQDLGLEGIDVVYPGDETYPLADKIRAVGLRRMMEDIAPLR